MSRWFDPTAPLPPDAPVAPVRHIYRRILTYMMEFRGGIVAERYATGVTQSGTLPSWSMAKSMLHAAIGLLVRDGRLRVDDRALIAAWQQPGDPRVAITIDSLLHMTSGRHFVEDYVDDRVSDTIKMLFCPGAADMGAFAAAFPLDHAPDTFFNYSSGTSNILSSIVRDKLSGQDAYVSPPHKLPGLRNSYTSFRPGRALADAT